MELMQTRPVTKRRAGGKQFNVVHRRERDHRAEHGVCCMWMEVSRQRGSPYCSRFVCQVAGRDEWTLERSKELPRQSSVMH